MRTRKVGEEFFNDEIADLTGCSPLARLLFLGLQCSCDREGRMEVKPTRIKRDVLPNDSVVINELLRELEIIAGVVHTYEVEGKRYLQIVEFPRWQQPHHHEPESVIPAPSSIPRMSRQTGVASPECRDKVGHHEANVATNGASCPDTVSPLYPPSNKVSTVHVPEYSTKIEDPLTQDSVQGTNVPRAREGKETPQGKKRSQLERNGSTLLEVRPHVFLTQPEIDRHVAEHGQDEFDYWADQLQYAASRNVKKWQQGYQDHNLCIHNWRRNRLAEGSRWNPQTKLYEKPTNPALARKSFAQLQKEELEKQREEYLRGRSQ